MAFVSTNILQRVRADHSNTTTFVESALSTNLAIDRGYIWLINRISFYSSTPLQDPAAGTSESYVFQITRESKAAIITTLNTPDLICLVKEQINRSAAIGTDAGPLYFRSVWPLVVDFPIPLAFAGNNLYFATQSSCTLLSVMSAEVQFTLQKVKENDYLRIASALLLT